MNSERHFSPTLKQLRAFVAVYQLRKLSAAATQLFLTQSAVSVLIQRRALRSISNFFFRVTWGTSRNIGTVTSPRPDAWAFCEATEKPPRWPWRARWFSATRREGWPGDVPRIVERVS